MEYGTPKGLLKDVKMTMGFAYFANAGEKEGCNTYGGNAMPATQSQTITGCSCKKSKSRTTGADKVYVDGSAIKIGASAYAGWGMWSPDNANLKENGPLKGKDQGSDRAE
eukprot:285476-Heterocapsa_arctica.AAC.1